MAPLHALQLTLESKATGTSPIVPRAPFIDGVANAVVGYTDALVAKMFSRDGVPVPTADSLQELLGQLHGLEAELHLLDERSASAG